MNFCQMDQQNGVDATECIQFNGLYFLDSCLSGGPLVVISHGTGASGLETHNQTLESGNDQAQDTTEEEL